jgi:hypothetical protein
LKAQAKTSHSPKIVQDGYIATPTFFSPDKSDVYYDGDRITIIADYGQSGLNVTADMSVVDSQLSEITPVIDRGDGTYKLKSLRLSGTSLIIGQDIAICFTAQDEAGHLEKTSSTYLVTIKLRPTNGGSNLQAPVSLTVVPGNTQVQIFWSEIPGAKKIVISFKDENNIARQLEVSKKYGDAVIHNLKNGFTYTFYVAGMDKHGLIGPAKSIQGTPMAPVVQITTTTVVASAETSSNVITPTISLTAASTQKTVAQAAPTKEEVTPPSQIAQTNLQNQNTTTSQTRNWSKWLLAISILIIAAGASVGGYYGYEWYMAKKEEKPTKPQGPRSKSRW